MSELTPETDDRRQTINELAHRHRLADAPSFDGVGNELAWGVGYVKGFHAGHAAAGQNAAWVKIEDADSLPKEKGRYFWKCMPHMDYPYTYRPFDPAQEVAHFRFYRANYSHWMPIPPYSPEVQGGNDGE